MDARRLFVVNTDGTGLRLITPKQNAGTNDESYAISVAWSPDSARLLVHAFRQIGTTPAPVGSLYVYNADGTGETLLVQGVSNGLQGSLAIDWAPDGRHFLYAVRGGPHHAAFGYVIADALNPGSTRFSPRRSWPAAPGPSPARVARARFSPDSQRIVFGRQRS